MEIVCAPETYRRFEYSSLRQKKGMPDGISFFCLTDFEEDSRVGAVLREQNALPYDNWFRKNSSAKSAIDNRRAGRAAKGENPLLCANKYPRVKTRGYLLISYSKSST